MFFIFITVNIFKYIGIANSTLSSFIYSFNGLENLRNLNEDVNKYTIIDITKQPIESLNNVISLKNLNFAYNKNIDVLNDISLDIKINEKVAIVGKSGSGKSTLADIISGFHDDYNGEINIDNENFKNINKDSWRRLIGYVSQETFIFNDTVKNNLLFGQNRDIDQKILETACDNAMILDLINSLDHGFETKLGERGVILSGGEKQRLAIARIFFKKSTNNHFG